MSDELFNNELALLPRMRQKEILAKKSHDDQKRSLAGDVLVKKYLSQIYGVDKEKLVIQKGEHGKPYVLNLPAHFSVSHSGQYTVVAISDHPIGVDLEIIGDFSAIVAKKLFNDDELQYISGNGPSQKKSTMQRNFFEIWTAKEAYLKYTGQGLSGGMQSFDFKTNNGKLIPNNKSVKLIYDYSVPGAVTAIITDL